MRSGPQHDLALGVTEALSQYAPDQIRRVRRQLADDLAVGGLDEAVLVDASEGGEAADEADVGAFRRLDWADTAVVAEVHVADVEAGAVAGEAARA